jgi:hypothetical protein
MPPDFSDGKLRYLAGKWNLSGGASHKKYDLEVL